MVPGQSRLDNVRQAFTLLGRQACLAPQVSTRELGSIRICQLKQNGTVQIRVHLSGRLFAQEDTASS